MKRFVSALVVGILVWLPGTAFAQVPGEPKPPGPYDATGDAKYRFERWTPDERVRDAQRVLQDKGYYRGPLDGLMTPEMRRAVWNFQKAQGIRPSGRLEAETMAGLGLTSTGTAGAVSSPETPPSALPHPGGPQTGPSRSAPPRDTFQAP